MYVGVNREIMMGQPIKMIIIAVITFFLGSASLVFSQDELFEIARFEDFNNLTNFSLALNPDTSTIVLSYEMFVGENSFPVVVNTAKIKKNGKLNFSKKTSTVSNQGFTNVASSVIYQPAENQFLVLWSELGEGTDVFDIGGRLLNKKGKPTGEPFAVLSVPRSQSWPRSFAYTGTSAEAPDGAAYFIVWTHDSAPHTVEGQWFDSAAQPIGDSRVLAEFDGSQWIMSSVNAGNKAGLVSLLEVDFGSGAPTSSLRILRVPFENPLESSVITLGKEESPARPIAELFAVSDTRIFLGTSRSFGAGGEATENFEIRNKAKLGLKKKPVTILPGERSRSLDFVTLDDGRFFQVILTTQNEVVIQEITAKGKPKGALLARIPSQNKTFLALRAIALPGTDEMLVVLGEIDQAAELGIVHGTVIPVN